VAHELPGVFDDGAGDRDGHQRGQHDVDRAARSGGGRRVARMGLVMVGAGEQEAVTDQAHRAEQQTRHRQLHRPRNAEIDCARTDQATQYRPGRPDRVQRVDDESSVSALKPQPVRVLRDVGHRIGRPGAEQGRRQRLAAGRQPGREGERRDQHAARDRDPCGAVATDQRRRGGTGQQRATRERGHRETEAGVRQSEIGLDLGITRQQAGEQCAVGQEQRRRRDPGPAVADVGSGAAHVRRGYG
jgi:hypothetical protein